jgi:5-oxoprolinase (ATP-hydrolysing)
MAEGNGRYRVGFDIGGTFTDFVLYDADSAEVRVHKCLTTPDDPSLGALEGLNEILAGAGLGTADVSHLIHGTTLVTNAIIERQGAKLALLTTQGFRDILEMGTEQRYDIHDLFLEFPEPLVPRALRREIDERMSRDGDVVVALDLDQVRSQAADLVAAGVEAIAVCFLHAYKNPAHEQVVRDLLSDAYPQIAVSLSSDVQPELREYERTSTTTANAYVQPLMQRYVDRLVEAFTEQGFAGQFHLMQSAGGLVSPKTAVAYPIRLLESGPAGGGLATAFFGGRVGKSDVISFDMGGTTAKACLIENGKANVAPMLEAARVHRFKKGSGLPIKAPVIDMIEVGAGGGSIARFDKLGLLKVGPGSAGADPGPACYGKGGTEPTVTDANLLLGYLDPAFFLGGRMSLDKKASESALARVAKPLNLTAIEAAWGIYDIVCESMAGAARVHIVEKGRDPRRYSMVAMGGAGPAHAARVARKLGVGEVIVPPASGAASALGFLVAPISFEFARSLPSLLDEMDFGAVNDLLAELEKEGRTLLSDAGVEASDVTVTRHAEMRYFGQMREIDVPLQAETLDAGSVEQAKAAFDTEYKRLYAHLYEGPPVQALNWRVLCSGPTPEVEMGSLEANDGASLKGRRQAYFPEAGGFVEVPVHDRYALAPGQSIEGPAIIEERESTTVVPPGDSLAVDDLFNLCLTIGRETNATAVVPAGMPLDEAVARIESDPIGLEIMWSRLINIAEECWHTVIRTAFSLIIGEAQDFGCELLDAKGRQLAHSPRAMPVFSLTLPLAVQTMIERHPVDTLKPGDVLITNDPWKCAGHLFDIAIVTPIFRDDRVVALAGNVGHVTDIGGTKNRLHAHDLYEEGLQIPPMKLVREGKINEDLIELITENVRSADQVIGDLHALISANAAGAERIHEFMEEYGMHDLEALATVIQGRAERAMRSAIGDLRPGTYEGEIWNNSLDGKERFPIRLNVSSDEIEVDFAGAPDQHDRGAVNCTLSYTKAHAVYPLKCILSPEVPGNAGAYRPFQVKAPKGSILNCDKPMPVNMRTRTGWYIAPNIFNVMAEAAPDKVQAFTALPCNARFYGIGPDDRHYSDHLFQGGGQGASAHGDGKSAVMFPTSAANTSIELFESRVPMLVVEKAYVSDSGGAGRQRGGLGQVIVTRKLLDDARPAQVGLYPNGVGVPTPGLFKGRAGAESRAWVRNDAGEVLTDMGTGGLVVLADPSEISELHLAGGSGYGDPLERPLDAVQEDLDGGYVTAAGAERDYGCVVDTDGRIDAAASDNLREHRSKEPQAAE